jgi:opacity protein-like surface antigen
LSFDESKETDWADPILGVQVQYQVFKPLALMAKADVGGFGAASHLTYQFFAGTQTQITRNIYVQTGYRYLQTNYSSNGFTYNVSFNGPQITFGVNF